jgi:DNA invertase Pin-like site-specific DNA recombinase
MDKWISYIRVSTQKQGKSGLGLEAQRHAVDDYVRGLFPEIKSKPGRVFVPGPHSPIGLIKEFVEIETGKNNSRPKLEAAIAACRVYGAKLIIAKLDRLSRNAHFLLGLKEAGVDFVCVDMPNATRLTVGIMAVVAEDEAQRISDRTKAALAAAKKRGTKLGGWKGKPMLKRVRLMGTLALQKQANNKATDLEPIIRELQKAGKTTLRELAAGLNDAGVPTPRDQGEWSAIQVQRVLNRL